MMLSQLTFRESESLTKAGAAREETARSALASLSWRPFLFSHPPSLPEIKVRTWFFCGLLELRAEKNCIF